MIDEENNEEVEDNVRRMGEGDNSELKNTSDNPTTRLGDDAKSEKEKAGSRLRDIRASGSKGSLKNTSSNTVREIGNSTAPIKDGEVSSLKDRHAKAFGGEPSSIKGQKQEDGAATDIAAGDWERIQKDFAGKTLTDEEWKAIGQDFAGELDRKWEALDARINALEESNDLLLQSLRGSDNYPAESLAAYEKVEKAVAQEERRQGIGDNPLTEEDWLDLFERSKQSLDLANKVLAESAASSSDVFDTDPFDFGSLEEAIGQGAEEVKNAIENTGANKPPMPSDEIYVQQLLDEREVDDTPVITQAICRLGSTNSKSYATHGASGNLNSYFDVTDIETNASILEASSDGVIVKQGFSGVYMVDINNHATLHIDDPQGSAYVLLETSLDGAARQEPKWWFNKEYGSGNGVTFPVWTHDGGDGLTSDYSGALEMDETYDVEHSASAAIFVDASAGDVTISALWTMYGGTGSADFNLYSLTVTLLKLTNSAT